MRTLSPARTATARTVLARTARMVLAVPCLAAGAACGVQPTGIIDAGPRPAADGAAASVTVYLVREGRLAPVARPGLPNRPNLAVDQLSVPVTLDERRRGFANLVTEQLSVLHAVRSVSDMHYRGSALVVSVQDAVSVRRWPRLAQAQLACTAEAIPGVARMVLHDGRRGRGEPQIGSCDDYRDLLA